MPDRTLLPEKTLNRESAVDEIQRFLEQVRAGQLQHNGEKIAVPDQVRLEIEADDEEGGTELKIELSW